MALLVPDFAVLARLPFVDFVDLAVEALEEAEKEMRRRNVLYYFLKRAFFAYIGYYQYFLKLFLRPTCFR